MSNLSLKRYGSVDELPQSGLELLQAAGARDFEQGVEWYRTLERHAVDPGDEIRYHTLEEMSGRVIAILPMLRPEGRTAPRAARSAVSLSNYYTSLFAPIVAADRDEASVLEGLVQELCMNRPRWNMIRLSPLAMDSAQFARLVEPLRRPGMFVNVVFSFGKL